MSLLETSSFYFVISCAKRPGQAFHILHARLHTWGEVWRQEVLKTRGGLGLGLGVGLGLGLGVGLGLGLGVGVNEVLVLFSRKLGRHEN